MQKGKVWLLLFAIVFIVHLVAVATGFRIGEWATKPLLIPLLGLHFVSGVTGFATRPSLYILVALFFSWLGDVLLIFQSAYPVFFLFGLSAFLLAHIGYILFFYFLRNQEGLKLRPYLLVAVAAYYAILISLLSPYLGEMRWPVRVYGLVISAMLMLAAHGWFLSDKKAGSYLCNGAMLFVLSDSLLAVNKFYHPFPGAGLAVMATYGLAQLLITAGAKQYLRNRKWVR